MNKDVKVAGNVKLNGSTEGLSGLETKLENEIFTVETRTIRGEEVITDFNIVAIGADASLVGNKARLISEGTKLSILDFEFGDDLMKKIDDIANLEDILTVTVPKTEANKENEVLDLRYDKDEKVLTIVTKEEVDISNLTAENKIEIKSLDEQSIGIEGQKEVEATAIESLKWTLGSEKGIEVLENVVPEGAKAELLADSVEVKGSDGGVKADADVTVTVKNNKVTITDNNAEEAEADNKLAVDDEVIFNLTVTAEGYKAIEVPVTVKIVDGN